MRLGAQMSTAGGLYTAFQRGQEATCDTMMIFTKSNRQWQAKALTEEDVAAYKKASEEFSDIYPVGVHASYLINIASPNDDLWEKSYQALKVEVERAGLLDIPLLTFHPGSYMESSPEAGLAKVARGLKRLVAETAGSAPHTTICLETMAGQGTHLGYRFEHLASILEQVGSSERLGVCLDTCHVFAGGYDIRTLESYEATLAEFDRVVGLQHLKFFHFNDTKHELGSRKDRHEHIGQGYIGLEGFANFVNDPRWADYPAHLETPKTETDDAGNTIDMDVENLKVLRGLIRT